MKLKRILLLILSFVLLSGACMTSCKGRDPQTDDPEKQTAATTDQGSESESEPGTEPEPGPDDPGYVEPVITGPYAGTIMQANRLADGVQAYYATSARRGYRIENKNMRLEYNISSTDAMLVTSLTNAAGNKYLENTMDVFLTMEDGKTYLCTRTGEAEGGTVVLQYLPHELVGQYFEIA